MQKNIPILCFTGNIIRGKQGKKEKELQEEWERKGNKNVSNLKNANQYLH